MISLILLFIGSFIAFGVLGTTPRVVKKRDGQWYVQRWSPVSKYLSRHDNYWWQTWKYAQKYCGYHTRVAAEIRVAAWLRERSRWMRWLP